MQSLLHKVFPPLLEHNASEVAAAAEPFGASGDVERRVSDSQHIHFGPEQRWAFLSSPAFDVPTRESRGPLWNSAFRIWKPSDSI